MANRKSSVDFVNRMGAFANPAQCLNDIVQAWTAYMQVAEEARTERCKIAAWEKTTLAEIHTKQDLLIGYLERSFDERARNFQLLFQAIDHAISSGDNQQLGLMLHAIVELAKSSPFKDLADLSTVKAALNDPNHTWEF